MGQRLRRDSEGHVPQHLFLTVVLECAIVQRCHPLSKKRIEQTKK
jgi:hypothetical protein